MSLRVQNHTGDSKYDDDNNNKQLLCCYPSKTALLTFQTQQPTTLNTKLQYTANTSRLSHVLVWRTVNICGPLQRRKRESDVVTARITQTETLSPLRTVSGSQNTRVMSQRDVIDYNQPPIGLLTCWIIL